MTVTGGMICLALAANLFVVPALANALTLQPFTSEAMNIVGTRSVGYMGAINYTLPITASAICQLHRSGTGRGPEFLIAWREEFLRLPPAMRAQFRAVLLSHPTELDGSGGMVLLRCEPGYAPESPGPPSAEPPPASEPPEFDV